MADLAGKQVLLGITGGVAAYKAAEFARRLMDEGAQVQVVMTAGAQQFITAVTLQALTGRPVADDAWDRGVPNAMPHIELTRRADVLVVAPATAHFMARLAHGMADDLLSTLALARPRALPLLVAPAMNVEMWDNPATQRNVAQLAADGIGVLGPASGDQACGEVGAGRMLEPHELVEDVIAALQPKVLAGRRVLLTAGPTFEPIDPVRGITNLSSGRTGFALARALREAGASVTLVAGPTALATPRGVTRVDVTTAQQMHDAVMAGAGAADVFVAVAAVADWRVAQPARSKLKKDAAGTPPALTFTANPDILASVAALPAAPYCVGFAAETDDVVAHAQDKRVRKNVPLIVANRAQDALGASASELVLIDADGTHVLPHADKLAQARRLVGEIARRLGTAR